MTLSGCNSEGAFNGDNSREKPFDEQEEPTTELDPSIPVPEPTGSLYQIDITPTFAESYIPVQYSAVGKYSDGTESDITDEVDWVALYEDVASLDSKGVAMPHTAGTTSLVATHDGITSNEAVLNVVPTMVCGHELGSPLSTEVGGGINDTSRTNGAGPCLKVRKVIGADGGEKLFTSSPSLELMERLGYTRHNSSTNSGDTYAQTYYEAANAAPEGEFVRFRQDGEGVAFPGNAEGETPGVGGQADRWCKKLGEIDFAGYVNWRLVTVAEVEELYDFENDRGLNMYARFGWPLGWYAWTSDTLGDKYYYSTLAGRYSPILSRPFLPLYVNCVAYL